MREYSPYMVTQLRACMTKASAVRLKYFEIAREIGNLSRPFHMLQPVPPLLHHPAEVRGSRRQKSLIFRAMLATSRQRVGFREVNQPFWANAEEYIGHVKVRYWPKLVECGETIRWDTKISPKGRENKFDMGNCAVEVLQDAYDSGLAKKIYQLHVLSVSCYIEHWDMIKETRRIGISNDALVAMTRMFTQVNFIHKMRPVPTTDQAMVDLYWEAQIKAGQEGRMTLHKAMLAYMTDRYMESSKVVLGNWLEHRLILKTKK